ncbi:hypothetical protein NARC_10445 [Candidatus Nitrosocosmicus arcticus]|uniref:Uncharacterized protein n=1 Tax=Candidatus Nitrosocosmicus arcticus TaxID=2035267 RepID=A0A557SZK0_9ARCH|nr:hypothetical protein NARC_10445 [Candidatus Nitrosocosmicus arcticus]
MFLVYLTIIERILKVVCLYEFFVNIFSIIYAILKSCNIQLF